MNIIYFLQAARPASQLYILLPLVLGFLIATEGGFSFSFHFILLLLYSISIQLFIVFGNDYADQETDKLNSTYTIFSGGSRVLVDGTLKPESIRNSFLIMGFVSFLVSLVFVFQGLYLAFLFWLLSVVSLLCYSYPPFKLSYKGGGDLLQTLGLAIILPLYGYSIGTLSLGDNPGMDLLTGFPFRLLTVLVPTQWACAISTSLPDAPSDRLSHKRSFTVIFGDNIAKISILVLHTLSVIFLSYIFQDIENNKGLPIHNPESTQLFGSMVVPVLGIIFGLAFIKGKPGDKKLSAFVFLSLFVSISIQTLLIWHLLGQ